MTYGQIVARRYKRQYFCEKTGWKTYPSWPHQPEEIHLILLELKSKRAIDTLIGNESWTERLPKKPAEAKRRKEV